MSMKIMGVFSQWAKLTIYLSARTLLWHGSRLSNWVGILSQGLRVAPPEAPVTGYMVGWNIKIQKDQSLRPVLGPTRVAVH